MMGWAHLLAWLLGAAIASTSAWQLQDWRLGGQISALQVQHATALAKAKADALAIERANTTRYQGALNEARTREAAARRDAGAESDGMRDQASAAARRISVAPQPLSLSTPLPPVSYSLTAAERIKNWRLRLTATPLMSEPSATPGR